MAQGFSKEESAKKAGLPDTYRLHRFARTREFADELRSAMLDHMGTNLAPRAVSVLTEIMNDKAVQARVRVDAAKTLLDRAGYAVSETQKKPLVPDDIEAMSVAELQEYIRAGERTLNEVMERRAKGAKVIEHDQIASILD